MSDEIWAWRHPRPEGAVARCIGRTDLPMNARRAKRLARRIQTAARRHGLPRVVITSPLQRCAAVGRWLRRWGWTHRIDAALLELDFGAWDGQPWSAIENAAIDAWVADFARHAPGGGEALASLLVRAAAWRPGDARVVVAHGGWMLARRWSQDGRDPPGAACDWPAAPRYGELWRLTLKDWRGHPSPRPTIWCASAQKESLQATGSLGDSRRSGPSRAVCLDWGLSNSGRKAR